ncbi:hypothetical protein BB561_006458 [Smittium simulii]|uniref:Uncharacterized protein n=1 Tax=Smittium simulii TaxID=133385 RepID=A0A2T9Y426_9FUNG|nr:hypothetical protein BB561_006458 [Smittium simulii]
MRLSIAGILLAITNVHFSTSAVVPKNELSNQNNNVKIIVSKNRSSRSKNRRYKSYLNKGKYWFWEGESDDKFLIKLRYKPKNYFGQRFEYLFENMREFKNRWLKDLAFRNRWDSEIEFRNLWFGRVDYVRWKYETIDNFDDYYYGRGRFSDPVPPPSSSSTSLGIDPVSSPGPNPVPPPYSPSASLGSDPVQPPPTPPPSLPSVTNPKVASKQNFIMDLIETLEAAQGAFLEEAQNADFEQARDVVLVTINFTKHNVKICY